MTQFAIFFIMLMSFRTTNVEPSEYCNSFFINPAINRLEKLPSNFEIKNDLILIAKEDPRFAKSGILRRYLDLVDSQNEVSASLLSNIKNFVRTKKQINADVYLDDISKAMKKLNNINEQTTIIEINRLFLGVMKSIDDNYLMVTNYGYSGDPIEITIEIIEPIIEGYISFLEKNKSLIGTLTNSFSIEKTAHNLEISSFLTDKFLMPLVFTPGTIIAADGNFYSDLGFMIHDLLHLNQFTQDLLNSSLAVYQKKDSFTNDIEQMMEIFKNKKPEGFIDIMLDKIKIMLNRNSPNDLEDTLNKQLKLRSAWIDKFNSILKTENDFNSQEIELIQRIGFYLIHELNLSYISSSDFKDKKMLYWGTDDIDNIVEAINGKSQIVSRFYDGDIGFSEHTHEEINYILKMILERTLN
jgi:hypothetical protein